MQSAVVIAFYIWLALSVAILLVRIARRMSRRSRSSSSTEVTEAQRAAVAEDRVIDLSDGAQQPAPRQEPVHVGSAPAAATATASNPAPRAQAPTPPPMPAPTLDLDRPAPTPPATPTPDDHRQAPAPVATLSQLLNGVVIPHQLTPVLPAGTEPTRQASSLLASGVDAQTVGMAMADELERIGYKLLPLGESELLAQRGDDVLSLAIDTEPEQADEVGHRRFPDAVTGDVVIEIWVGGGPNPV